MQVIFFIILNLLLYKINLIIEDIAVDLMLELCVHHIHHFVVGQKSYYGTIPVSFGDEAIVLDTYFYQRYTVNLQHIKDFVMLYKHSFILQESNKDISEILGIVLQQYLEAITEEENIYNSNIWDTLKQSKYFALASLASFIETALILDNPEYYISYEYLNSILNIIDFPNYVKTVDFQLGEYSVLQNFCHDMILHDLQVKNFSHDDFLHPSDLILKYLPLIVTQLLCFMLFRVPIASFFSKNTSHKLSVLILEILQILHQARLIGDIDLGDLTMKITELMLSNFDTFTAFQIIASKKRLALLLRNLIRGYKSIKR